MKKILRLAFVILAISILTSCGKKDYDCRIPAGTTVTNPDGSQTVYTDEEQRDCKKCTDDDVDDLEKKGFKCSEK
jgi:hypothetical protein